MSEPPKIGRLTDVQLRSAWVHEANDFTPWLRNNLDRLSDVLGIPLEPVDHEVRVEQFRADLLARNPADGTFVVIENQLEGGDHAHLGQLLTYLAGLEAHTVVWIASRFEKAHLSAIRWLNEHTVDPFAFFAVQVRTVRIGDSAIAPLFDVLERPNEWDRQLQEAARNTRQPSAIGNFRRAFWKHMFQRHPSEGDASSDYGAQANWRRLDSQNVIITQYLAYDAVGVFVRSGWNREPADILEVLESALPSLTARLGVAANAENPSFLLIKKLTLDMRDQSNWDRAADWLKAEADRYEAAVKDVLGGIG